MPRRAVAIALAVIVLVAVSTAVAFAHTVTGSQNPQLRVTVGITPVNAHAGQTIVARVTVTNTTNRTLNVNLSIEWDTPGSGIGEAAAGPMGPGVIAHQTFRRKVTATSPKGAFMISARASDHRGASHAAARATAR